MANKRGWIGVDLDGTLAEHYWPQKGPYDPLRIGDPVPLMVERVKKWLADGIEVRVFTARVAVPSYGISDNEALDLIERTHSAISLWTSEHVSRPLAATATKDYQMAELWDDRAVGVIPDTGLRADGKP